MLPSIGLQAQVLFQQIDLKQDVLQMTKPSFCGVHDPDNIFTYVY